MSKAGKNVIGWLLVAVAVLLLAYNVAFYNKANKIQRQGELIEAFLRSSPEYTNIIVTRATGNLGNILHGKLSSTESERALRVAMSNITTKIPGTRMPNLQDVEVRTNEMNITAQPSGGAYVSPAAGDPSAHP